jgi:hypothetical protein
MKLTSFLLVIAGIFSLMHTNPSKPNVKEISDSKPQATEGFAVVELFTSEGCSSCPSADEILRGLATHAKVFPLSFHVTYWNRLGWKDPFSQTAFDERQYDYGTRFKLNSVYTPQVVINGNTELVGSRRSQVEKSISQALTEAPSYQLTLTKNIKDKSMSVAYKIDKKPISCVLNIALVERNLEVKVPRGENEGRTLKHDNVVRLFKTLKIGSNTEGVTDFTITDDFKLKDCSVIAYLQNEKMGRILAAARQ